MRDFGGRESAVRVLVIDDDPSVSLVMSRTLERHGFAVATFNDPAAGFAYVQVHRDDIDVILLDVDMPGVSGLQVLAQIKQLDCASAVVMWTADGTAGTATKAMRAGAFTYVTKPVEQLDTFLATLHSAASFCFLRRHARLLEQRITHTDQRARLRGESPAMRALRERLGKLAASDVSVVVTGESGTGKELVARAIHEGSARAHRPFVAINCGAIAESMIDSELFGHTKGAFTGAVAARPGLFVEADGGTVFLDEIAELPLGAQARLLRVLQEREVRPVGADQVRTVDVRVVAATHADLQEGIAEKRFREDLFYRLNVATLHVPPLRERLTDVPLLAAHMLAKHGGNRVVHLTASALAALTGYAWPGNVRELENALLHALALTPGDTIDDVSLPVSVTSPGRAAVPVVPYLPEALGWSDDLSLAEAKKRAVDDFERRYVANVLTRTRGNLTQASKLAGLDRANLRRVLSRLGVDAAQFRDEE